MSPAGMGLRAQLSPRSFRLRLAILSAGLAGTALVGFGLTAWLLIREANIRQLSESLKTQLVQEAAIAHPIPYWANYDSRLAQIFDAEDATWVALRVINADGKVLYQSEAWPGGLNLPTPEPAPRAQRPERSGGNDLEALPPRSLLDPANLQPELIEPTLPEPSPTQSPDSVTELPGVSLDGLNQPAPSELPPLQFPPIQVPLLQIPSLAAPAIGTDSTNDEPLLEGGFFPPEAGIKLQVEPSLSNRGAETSPQRNSPSSTSAGTAQGNEPGQALGETGNGGSADAGATTEGSNAGRQTGSTSTGAGPGNSTQSSPNQTSPNSPEQTRTSPSQTGQPQGNDDGPGNNRSNEGNDSRDGLRGDSNRSTGDNGSQDGSRGSSSGSNAGNNANSGSRDGSNSSSGGDGSRGGGNSSGGSNGSGGGSRGGSSGSRGGGSRGGGRGGRSRAASTVRTAAGPIDGAPVDTTHIDLHQPPAILLAQRQNSAPPRGSSPGQPKLLRHRSATGQWQVGYLNGQGRQVAIAINLTTLNRILAPIRNIGLIVIPLILLLVAWGAWFLAGQALQPLYRVNKSIRRVNAQGLDQRISPGETDVEFGELIAAFNQMLGRLERSFSQASRFSGDAAHELKTPLAILQGQLEREFHQAHPGSALQQHLGVMLKEVSHLSGILRKLLLLSLADAGQMQLTFTEVNLSQLLQEQVEDIDLLAPQLKVEVAIEPGLKVRADQDLVQQILRNLTTNAVKYNQPEGWIRVEAERVGDRLVTTVTNQSEDLPLKVRERLFERFYRADATHRRKVQGSGLGLSLAREIARAHRGELRLAAVQLGETGFELVLPAPQQRELEGDLRRPQQDLQNQRS